MDIKNCLYDIDQEKMINAFKGCGKFKNDEKNYSSGDLGYQNFAYFSLIKSSKVGCKVIESISHRLSLIFRNSNRYISN